MAVPPGLNPRAGYMTPYLLPCASSSMACTLPRIAYVPPAFQHDPRPLKHSQPSPIGYATPGRPYTTGHWSQGTQQYPGTREELHGAKQVRVQQVWLLDLFAYDMHAADHQYVCWGWTWMVDRVASETACRGGSDRAHCCAN